MKSKINEMFGKKTNQNLLNLIFNLQKSFEYADTDLDEIKKIDKYMKKNYEFEYNFKYKHGKTIDSFSTFFIYDFLNYRNRFAKMIHSMISLNKTCYHKPENKDTFDYLIDFGIKILNKYNRFIRDEANKDFLFDAVSCLVDSNNKNNKKFGNMLEYLLDYDVEIDYENFNNLTNYENLVKLGFKNKFEKYLKENKIRFEYSCLGFRFLYDLALKKCGLGKNNKNTDDYDFIVNVEIREIIENYEKIVKTVRSLTKEILKFRINSFYFIKDLIDEFKLENNFFEKIVDDSKLDKNYRNINDFLNYFNNDDKFLDRLLDILMINFETVLFIFSLDLNLFTRYFFKDITVEGPDGVGKSDLVNSLIAYYSSAYRIDGEKIDEVTEDAIEKYFNSGKLSKNQLDFNKLTEYVKKNLEPVETEFNIETLEKNVLNIITFTNEIPFVLNRFRNKNRKPKYPSINSTIQYTNFFNNNNHADINFWNDIDAEVMYIKYPSEKLKRELSDIKIINSKIGKDLVKIQQAYSQSDIFKEIKDTEKSKFINDDTPYTVLIRDRSIISNLFYSYIMLKDDPDAYYIYKKKADLIEEYEDNKEVGITRVNIEIEYPFIHSDFEDFYRAYTESILIVINSDENFREAEEDNIEKSVDRNKISELYKIFSDKNCLKDRDYVYNNKTSGELEAFKTENEMNKDISERERKMFLSNLNTLLVRFYSKSMFLPYELKSNAQESEEDIRGIKRIFDKLIYFNARKEDSKEVKNEKIIDFLHTADVESNYNILKNNYIYGYLILMDSSDYIDFNVLEDNSSISVSTKLNYKMINLDR